MQSEYKAVLIEQRNPFPKCRAIPETPAIEIDGNSIPPIAYTSYLPESKYYAEVAQCGVHLYCFAAYIAHRGINIGSGIGPFRRGIWNGEDDLDFTDIHVDMRKILSVDTEAHVIMRLCLDVPKWWEKKHPEACCIREDGATLRQSFSSDVWLNAVGDVLRKIVEWIAASEYAPRFAGIHVAAGRTEEWFPHSFSDFNPARLVKFNEFLDKRYPTAAARAEAWRDSRIKDPAAALAVLAQPGGESWRDPKQDAAVMDACRFHSELMVDGIAELCRIVKESSGGRLLTGAFYGYHVYVADARMAHTALSKLLECPDIDYLASPNAYSHRKPGRDWPPMVTVDSVRLHGKIWMTENDTRTFLTRFLIDVAPGLCPKGPEGKYYQGGLWAGPETLEISVALMRNNTARMLTHGYGGWWFDMWGGWYSHPALLAEIRAAQDLWSEDIKPSDPGRVPPDSICVVMDERTVELDASFGSLYSPMIGNLTSLGHCGRPYVIYQRGDLQKLDLSEAPFIWLLGFQTLTEAERELTGNLIAKGGAVMHTDTESTRLMRSCTGDSQTETFLEFDHLRLTEEELRDALDKAGVHCFVSSGDIFYIGRGYAAIHAATEGVKHIDIPGSPKLRQVLPPAAGEVPAEFFMNQYETRIFRIVG